MMKQTHRQREKNPVDLEIFIAAGSVPMIDLVVVVEPGEVSQPRCAEGSNES